MSWAEFQANRHHHFLRDFPTRELLQDHLAQEAMDADNVQSILAWRDGVAESWGSQFSYDDGRPMTLYDAWQHGAGLLREAQERQTANTPKRQLRPIPTGDTLSVQVPRGQGAYGQLMGRLMQMSLRAQPRMTPEELAEQCHEWAKTYPECQEALERAAWQFEAMAPKEEEIPF